MTKEKSTVPRLRFPGFTDAWKQRKLGEVVYRSNITSSNKTLPRLEFEDINSGTGTLNKDIRQKIYDSRKGLEFKEEDILFGKLRPYLKKWWFAEYKGIAVGDFWNLKSDIWDNRFLFTYVQSNSFQVVANDTSGTKMPRSDWKLVSNSIAIFPTLPEQEAIGSFFSDLDQLITLHQRKLDDVKELKKALLQKMFPKGNGNDFPELRFPEFTDAWKQRKFSDLAEVRRGLTYSPSAIRSHGVRVLRSSNINEDTFVFGEDDVFVDKSVVKIPLVEEGDILITSANGSSRLVGKHSIIKGLPSNSAIHGGFMLLASSKVPCFLNAFMSSTWYHKFIGLYVAGGNGAIGNLNKSDLDEQIVLVPTLPEQEAIGSFFSDLDQLITLHQRQLDHLKLLKKALLQQMFI
ncbi:TPA: restriction endonuclease subunit S [Streptococcus suis]